MQKPQYYKEISGKQEFENLPPNNNIKNPSNDQSIHSVNKEIHLELDKETVSDAYSQNLLLKNNKVHYEKSKESIFSANAWHSLFSPLHSDIKINSKPPAPKFKPIKNTNLNPNFLHSNFNSRKTISEIKSELEKDIRAIGCPISICNKFSFDSDYIQHFKSCHRSIPIERICFGKHTSLFLDAKVSRENIIKCHYLFLLRDKFSESIELENNNEYDNYLPILFMSTKINLFDLIDTKNNEHLKNMVNDCNEELLIVWLTNLIPSHIVINYCITAWPRYSKLPECHLSRSGKMPSARYKINIKELYKSGQAMILTQTQCNKLTSNGKNMIEFQIIIN